MGGSGGGDGGGQPGDVRKNGSEELVLVAGPLGGRRASGFVHGELTAGGLEGSAGALPVDLWGTHSPLQSCGCCLPPSCKHSRFF